MCFHHVLHVPQTVETLTINNQCNTTFSISIQIDCQRCQVKNEGGILVKIITSYYIAENF